jgi:transcriptional regulator with XRE-family HTH domain
MTTMENSQDIPVETRNAVDWPAWIRGLGRQTRAVRELLGLSQEQVARMAGVSQGAVSRLESARGLATPLLVVMKIHLALSRSLATIDTELLSDEARDLLAADIRRVPGSGGFAAMQVLREPELEEIIRLFRGMPERHRQKLISVVRATVSALGGNDEVEEQDAARKLG